jgi:hypothetical protein
MKVFGARREGCCEARLRRLYAAAVKGSSISDGSGREQKSVASCYKARGGKHFEPGSKTN